MSTPPVLSEKEDLSGAQYHQHIRRLSVDNPHLSSLLVYSEAVQDGRVKGQLGSYESDSILVAEAWADGRVIFDRIDCYDASSIDAHQHVLSGERNNADVQFRLLVVEDLSPAAVEILGQGFCLDPHIFYYHLGFDTRRSAMRTLIDPVRESMIPVTWYMPEHGPSNFVSVPVPCDLSSSRLIEYTTSIPMDTTYARQAYSPLTTLSSDATDWRAPLRAFHRLSLVFVESQIPTVIVFAFPTWRRLAKPATENPGNAAYIVLDSPGYPLTPATPASLSPINEAGSNTNELPWETYPKSWSEGQQERVGPLFRHLLLHNPIQLDRFQQDLFRERVLFWLYSKLHENNFLASQMEARCWRDVRQYSEPGRIAGHKPQRSKRMFRDSMTKSTELMEVSKITLDTALRQTRDQVTLSSWQRKVEVLITYQKARIAQVLLNVNDEQSEIEMDLMVSQLEENRYAIEQAKTVTRLTKLAFIFVPLATVCSAFGMNVSLLDPHPSIWWFVCIAVVATLLGVITASTVLERLLATIRVPLKAAGSRRAVETTQLAS